jgi:hypothetical protein
MSGIPNYSPTYLRWIIDLSGSSEGKRTIQTRYTAHDRILIDVVVMQKVIEYSEHPLYKNKTRELNNVVMGARVYPELIEQMERDVSSNQLGLIEEDLQKKIDFKAIPTEKYARDRWIKVIKEKLPERLTHREYGYFKRNGEVKANNLVAKTPDSLDKYNIIHANQYFPGEYGSIYVYEDDFTPRYTHEEIEIKQKEVEKELQRQQLRLEAEHARIKREREEAPAKFQRESIQEAKERQKKMFEESDIVRQRRIRELEEEQNGYY